MIVVDTNVLAYFFIEGEHTEEARALYGVDPDWRSAPLWRSEMLNVLTTSWRVSVLNRSQAFDVLERASAFMSGREDEPSGRSVLALAQEAGISAYDAHFIAVARMHGRRLVTADRRLARACADDAILLESKSAGGRR